MNLLKNFLELNYKKCVLCKKAIALSWVAGSNIENIDSRLLIKEIENQYQSTDSIIRKIKFDSRGRLSIGFFGEMNELEIHSVYLNKFKEFIDNEIKLGQFMLGLGASKYYRSMTLRAAFALAQMLNINEQYKMYFDPNLKPVGVITWAWVNQECMDRIEKADDLSLHPAEWNEGRILWFRDIAVSGDSASEIAHDLSVGLFPEISECYVTMHSRKLGRSIPVKFSSDERTQLSGWIQNQI